MYKRCRSPIIACMGEINTALAMNELLNKMQDWAQSFGFQQLGVSDLDLAASEEKLLSWLAAGFHGDMDYMSRHPHPRLDRVRQVLHPMPEKPPECSLDLWLGSRCRSARL